MDGGRVPVFESGDLLVRLFVEPFEGGSRVQVNARADTGCSPALILRRDLGEDWGDGVGRGDEMVTLANGSEAPVYVYSVFVWFPGAERPGKPIEILRFREFHEKQETLVGLKWLRDFEFCVRGGSTLRLFSL